MRSWSLTALTPKEITKLRIAVNHCRKNSGTFKAGDRLSGMEGMYLIFWSQGEIEEDYSDEEFWRRVYDLFVPSDSEC